MSPDLIRIEVLLERLRELELRIPAPHERSIQEVARAALVEEIRLLSQRLRARNYWRPARLAHAG